MTRLFALICLAAFTMSLVPAPVINTSDRPLWMRYPTISPDGKTIVFMYKGDLYKVDASGGTALPITIGDAYEFMPVFSPDGKSIVFASDRYGNFDLFIIPIDGGTAQRLTYNSANDYPYSFSADGKSVIYGSSRIDQTQMTQFPNAGLGEVYSVGISGGREKQEMTIAAEDIKWNKAQTKMLFHDKKGYEDPLRKHHTSSVARDIWLFDKTKNDFQKLSDFEGEDRSPVWSQDENEIYYLSEKSGSFNVWKMNPNTPNSETQITQFDKNPVRFLSISTNNTLCFGYDGEIYTQKPGEQPKLVSIKITTDERFAEITRSTETSGVSEMAVAPNGKEVAFIVKGDVFVSSMEGGVTKRITNTPETERSISFSPDGKAILYASERENIWGIYQSKIKRSEEKYFYSSTLLLEETLVKNGNESFQPAYSPDGKEIAYLENRTAVTIYNLATKKTRNILPADRNYSYADGDQSFAWSPDSKYILVSYLQKGNWHTQMGLVDVSNPQNIIPLTQNGFDNYGGLFQMNGKTILYYSNKNGMKNVASHGSQNDIYAQFLDQKTFDLFNLNKTDFDAYLEKEKEGKDKKGEDKSDDKKKKTEEPKKVEPLIIEKEGIFKRKNRLTEYSGYYGDCFLSEDGQKLYYFADFDEGTNLYVRDYKENETKILARLNAKQLNHAQISKDGKTIYAVINGSLSKITLEGGKNESIPFKAELTRNENAERAYLFEHIWRQVTQKFYKKDLHGVDWNYYKQTYAKFLPHINNNRDFAEMCSELLGELNASHTGCFYRPSYPNSDQTAEIGAFFDESYTGNGLKINEIIKSGPLAHADSKVKAGDIIEKIDGQVIAPETNYYPFLNRKVDAYTLLSIFSPKTGKRWEETIKPINSGQLRELLYQRWIEKMQQLTEQYSNGKLGYMHVRGMNDEAYREFYDEVMGKYINKDALIVDTRFNGGGWMHDDLATFLSGKQYINFVPRGQTIGVEPGNKWIKPSCVLMCEGNYSDAHMFPVVYQTMGIGKLIGMPVAGTGTAVWWENLGHHNLVFGIPEVGVVDMDGNYYENKQCMPDVQIENDYKTMMLGEDAQLKKAVEVLLQK
ncbi:MAG: peptidase S41 [Bacteroidetes bacterium]|nr:peptidase S41 [Bacteroidota bacterium]